jgi:putative PEP-CTERM system histidine kinase
MLPDSLIGAGFAGHVAAAAGYMFLALLVVCWWNNVLPALMLAAASLATTLWAAVTAYDLYHGTHVDALSQVLEIARSCSWIVLLLTLLYWMPPVRRSSWAAAIVALGMCVAVLTVLFGNAPGMIDAGLEGIVVTLGHLGLAVLGLALVENLFRNSPQARYWSIKYLCFGAGALFAYDFFLYSDALLFHRLNQDLFLARGTTSVFVLPLLAVYAARNRRAGPEIKVSRRMVVHTATLLGAGLYLITMAAAGYYVRQFGGTWSSFLQIVFFFGALLLLLVPLSSSSFRAYLRVFVEKSFFKYRYDYREEWLRFIRTISSTDRGEDLRNRVVQAVCDIVESPEGALWLQREVGTFTLASSWNCSRWGLSPAEASFSSATPIVDFLERSHWIVNLEELPRAPDRYEGMGALPAWVQAIARAWLIVPLIRHERLFGIIILGRSRATRVLMWEDFDLLKTVGRQAASYLAEQETSEALAEARQFEAFNKRFAFIAHDIKNLVSQLSLILTNAGRHRGNAAFQQDANETLQRSVDKLNRMLRQLHAQPHRTESGQPVVLAPLLQEIVATRSTLNPHVSLHVEAAQVAVTGDEERIKAIVDHLVQNAVEAVGTNGRVHVRLSGAGKMAVVEIEDNGPGMDAAFIRDQLFRPFATTKGTGYGIGVYESREYATSLGGRLDVESHPGHGTIMRVSLPIVPA